jgi:3-phosphoshikimate 1-carboxyvinyltransferase
LSDALTITPIAAFNAAVRLPGSKSLTNRALLLSALAEGPCTLRDPLTSADDAKYMIAALKQLGYEILHDTEKNLLTVDSSKVRQSDSESGNGAILPPCDQPLFLGNAGTAYRFLTAACCLGQGRYHLDGVARMRQRPIGQLVEALHEIGGQVAFLGTPEFPPLMVTGMGSAGLPGGELHMPPTLSSQYISALLQIGPLCRKGLTIHFQGKLTSRPYVVMTIELMRRFGAQVTIEGDMESVHVEPGRYVPTDYAVEPDASNASYFLAAAAVVPGSRCTIEGLGHKSLQGDVGFADVLHQMGAGLAFGGDFIMVMAPPVNQPLRGIDIDLNAMPDMAQTLAVTALFAKGPTTIRNVGNLRVKETDRMAALRTELVKLGAEVEIQGDDLYIVPPENGKLMPAAIDTYDDHRMAMSFAVAGLRSPGVVINDPDCVNKTFPDYFELLSKMTSAIAGQTISTAPGEIESH